MHCISVGIATYQLTNRLHSISGLDIAGDNGELSGSDLTAGHGEGSGADVSVSCMPVLLEAL